MKTNKYTYYIVLQQDYGQGFEDVEFFVTNSMFYMPKADRMELKNCKENYTYKQPYPIRTIHRKELNVN